MQANRDGRYQALLALALLSAVGLSTSVRAQETRTPSSPSQATVAATEAAASWLELIDDGRYESAWESAGEEFRSVVTVRAWERRISSLRQGIGAHRERAVESASKTDSLPGGEQGEYVVVTYDSSFTTLTEAVETVIVARQEDGAWDPVGYFVRPAEGAGGPSDRKRSTSSIRII